MQSLPQTPGCTDSGFRLACLSSSSPVSALYNPSCSPLKAACMSKPFNPSYFPSLSLPFISFHLQAPCTALRAALSSCYTFLPSSSPPPLPFHPSHPLLYVCLSQPCEPATLSALSIQAYSPRGLERITFLTSPCQMFTTKIDRTAILTATSNNDFSLKTWIPSQ